MAKKIDTASNPFLKAAERQLNQQQAEKNSVTSEADRARQNAKDQNAFFEKNFIPLIDQLVDLPQKNGRRFVVETCRMVEEETAPRLFLTLLYAGGQETKNMMRGGRARGPSLYDKVSITIDRFQSAGDFDMRVIRYDKYEGSGLQHAVSRHTSVDSVMEALGDFVATVAPDRLAELGGPAVQPAPKPVDHHQASKELWGQVKDALEADPITPPPSQPRKPVSRGRRR